MNIKDTISSWFIKNPTICEQIQKLPPTEFVASKGLGGHGGALRLKSSLQGKYFFLKPRPADGTEERNYQIIQSTQPEVAKWMPAVYGVAQIAGKQFLVMENIQISQEGAKLRQLADIKLSKQLDNLLNPIVCNEEMIITRGKEKKATTRLSMAIACTVGPGFLATNGGIVRFFDYISSKNILRKSLRDTSTEHVKKLMGDLKQLQKDLEKSELAFIGVSIILIRREDGSIKPTLVDPAHMQCSKNLIPQIEKVLNREEAAKVFYEPDNQAKKNAYPLFKLSNSLALEMLIASMEKILAERERVKKVNER